MDLPLISTYVLNSVKDVIQGFISPKSYTVDVAGLLGAGDGPQGECLDFQMLCSCPI